MDCLKDLIFCAFALSLCRWLANFLRLFVVYFAKIRIFSFKLAWHFLIHFFADKSKNHFSERHFLQQ